MRSGGGDSEVPAAAGAATSPTTATTASTHTNHTGAIRREANLHIVVHSITRSLRSLYNTRPGRFFVYFARTAPLPCTRRRGHPAPARHRPSPPLKVSVSQNRIPTTGIKDDRGNRSMKTIPSDKVIYTFRPEMGPVATVSPGEVVRFCTQDCWSGQITSEDQLAAGIDVQGSIRPLVRSSSQAPSPGTCSK